MRRFDDLPVFTAGAFRAFEIDAAGIPMLQQFFESNPEYHLAVNGEAPGPNEARDELESLLPAGWPYKKKWVLGFFDEHESMVFSPQVSGTLDCSWSLLRFMAAVWRRFCMGVSNPGCGGTVRSGCASASSKEIRARSASGRIQAIWIFESAKA